MPKGIRGIPRAALPRESRYLLSRSHRRYVYYIYFLRSIPAVQFLDAYKIFFCSPERKLRITADIKFKFLEMVSNVYRIL